LKQTHGGQDEGAKEKVVDVKATGKFKPIGFKPIGNSAGDKTKKKKVKVGGINDERKKKKRKVDETGKVAQEDQPQSGASAGPASSEGVVDPATLAPPPEPQTADVDFDIFADAGEYEGIDLGDSDEEVAKAVPDVEEPLVGEPRKRGWFDEGDHESDPKTSLGKADPGPSSSNAIAGNSSSVALDDVVEEGEEIEKPATIKLQSLASSAVPSIRDILEADEALAKEEKRRARKEKNKKKTA
jgi:IK cytokine